MELQHVPLRNLNPLWPKIRPLLYLAMKRGDFSAFAPIEHAIHTGLADVWIATENGDIHAAAVSEYGNTETRKVCTIVACGGEDMGKWIHLLRNIEAKAKVDGCKAVRIIGREGWIRMLTSYRPRRVVLEKDI